MRTFVSAAAIAILILVPATASADGPTEEMTTQMHEWVNYERAPFEPVEVQVDGAKLTVFDATIESHPLEDDITIVRVIMRARRGDSPAVVSRAVLKDREGSAYPVAYVKNTPVKALNERGFKAYTFRLPETGQEALKSLAVTVAAAKDGAEPASTQVELAVGEKVRLSDLDDATFSALSAFLLLTTFIITAAAGI